MYIEKYKLEGKTYRMFCDVVLFPESECPVSVNVAEEKLNTQIESMIARGRYNDEAEMIDELYGYYVPQEIADTEDEESIRESVEDVYEQG